jgi:hypothetical protein
MIILSCNLKVLNVLEERKVRERLCILEEHLGQLDFREMIKNQKSLLSILFAVSLK